MTQAGEDEVDPDRKAKAAALDMLDVLTSPKSDKDPEYDVMKDVRRDDVMRYTDYNELKNELRRRGIRTNGNNG
jgi:hypothetical protein